MRILTCAAVAALWACPATAQILTPNGGVMSPYSPVWRTSYEHLETSNLRRDHLMLSWTQSPNRWTELSAHLPLMAHSVRFEGPGGTLRSDFEGIGDLRLRAKYNVLLQNDVMWSQRLAILGSVNLPTGDHEQSVGGVPVPRPLQIGLGNFGLSTGLVYSGVADKNRWSAALVYNHFFAHDGFRFGDDVDLQLAYWRRLIPARFAPAENERELRGVLELLARYHLPNTVGGAEDDASEGLEIVAAPGLQFWWSPEVLFETNVLLPVSDDTESPFGELDWGFSFNLKLLF
jgi:hypothetical protein